MDSTIITAKYQGYCSVCHFTFFRNEQVKYNGKCSHTDCIKALSDKYPRKMDNNYLKVFGDVNKKKLRELVLKQFELQ